MRGMGLIPVWETKISSAMWPKKKKKKIKPEPRAYVWGAGGA